MAKVDEELDRFIQDALAIGQSRDKIEHILNRAGWPEKEVERALGRFFESDFPIPVPKPRYSGGARDAFYYLLLFTALYMSAWSIGGLLFQLIDLALPTSSLEEASLQFRIERNLRRAIAGIIVFLPVYAVMEQKTIRLKRIEPEHRRSAIRRWLSYLTLYGAATLLLGDATHLVFTILEGEITLRILCRGAVIALIAAAIFWRFLHDLRHDKENTRAI